MKKQYKPYFREDYDDYEADNELLAKAIELHNRADSYLSNHEFDIYEEEKYKDYYIKLLVALQTFVEHNWKTIAKQLNIDLHDFLEITFHKPIEQYIDTQLKKGKEDLDKLIHNKSVQLDIYSYPHQIIKVFVEYDRYF